MLLAYFCYLRHEAARSAEKAYKSLKLKDACEIFLLDNMEELEKFIQKERENAKVGKNQV